MQEDLIKVYSDQTIHQYQSIIQFNYLLLTSLEKGIDAQLEAINSYSHINFEYTKSITNPKSIEDMQSFSVELLKTIEPLNNNPLKDSIKHPDPTQELISDNENIWQII